MERNTTVGVVTFAQETRFQVVDDVGAAHAFVLAHDAGADERLLLQLAHDRTRVCVTSTASDTLIVNVAHAIRRADTASEEPR